MFNILSHNGKANHNYTDIPSHNSQNGSHQEEIPYKMLMRMWEKRNPHMLLVGMKTSASTMEIIWRFIKKHQNPANTSL
jgi:hypothetical protein